MHILFFETENLQFMYWAKIKKEFLTSSAFLTMAEYVEQKLSFRLMRIQFEQTKKLVFYNRKDAPLPDDGDICDYEVIKLPCPYRYVQSVLLKKKDGKRSEESWINFCEKFFDLPARVNCWQKLRSIECSMGEIIIRRYYKKGRRANRSQYHQTGFTECQNNFCHIVDEDKGEWQKDVSLPVSIEAKADYYHSELDLYISCMDDSSNQNEKSFVLERWIDRQVQKNGKYLLRFASSELATPSDIKHIKEEILFAQKLFSGTQENYQLMRIELASSTRLVIFPMYYHLKDEVIPNIEQFAEKTEELLNYRLIRVVMADQNGLPIIDWTHKKAADRPEDNQAFVVSFTQGPNDQWINIPVNKTTISEPEIGQWLKDNFIHGKTEIDKVKFIRTSTDKNRSKFNQEFMIKNRLRNRKTDSKLEELLYKALLNEGLTPVLQQDIYWRGNLLTTLDLSFPEQKLAILADGHHWHSKPRDYIKDRVQDRRLQYLGWKVLRYPGQSIRNHLMKCIREIVEVLENSAHSNCTED